MLTFGNKGVTEELNLSAIFTRLASFGTVVDSAEVSASVDPSSPVLDPSPEAILDGDPIINTLAAQIGGIVVPPGLAVTQTVINGVVGCVYQLTYTATMSDGQVLVGQILLPVTPYTPFP